MTDKENTIKTTLQRLYNINISLFSLSEKNKENNCIYPLHWGMCYQKKSQMQ